MSGMGSKSGRSRPVACMSMTIGSLYRTFVQVPKIMVYRICIAA